MTMKNLIRRVLTVSGGNRFRKDDKLMSDDTQMTETSSCELNLEDNDIDDTRTTITGQSLLRGRISIKFPPSHTQEQNEEEELVDIIDRFQKYFALFDGRSNGVDPVHYSRVQKVVADLFHESVLDGQIDIAEDLLAKKTIINVHRIEKCRTGRIFYHLRVATELNPSVRQHITGFATLCNNGETGGQMVTEVETKVKIIRSPGGRRQQLLS